MNTSWLPVKVPSADTKNLNYKPFVFLSNDTNMSNIADDCDDSMLNTTSFSQNISVSSTNEVKDIPIEETTTKLECKEENMGRSTVNVIINENDHHKPNHKHHHKHHHHHNKKENKTIESSADIDLLPDKEEVFIDPIFCKNRLEDVKRKEEDQYMGNFLNLHLKLNHVDAWNEIDCERIDIDTTSPTNSNLNTMLTNEFSEETIELNEPPTKFEESEQLDILSNQNSKKCGVYNQGKASQI